MTNVASALTLPQLSDYEQLRLDNIHRNEEKLKQLGLLKPIVQSVASRRAKNRIKPKSSSKPPVPSGPTRSSTRNKRKIVSYYNHSIDEDAIGSGVRVDDSWRKEVSDDESSDYDEPNSTMDYDHEDTIYESDDDNVNKNNKRTRRHRTVHILTPTKTNQNPPHNTNTTATGGIFCEYAKSSRSTCRKCRIKIEKNTPRVGMQAWIVGRQALTWQCPSCFLANLTCALEKTGRSRCQITRENFDKGEVKVGLRSHTATFWYGLDVVGKVLGVVLSLVAAEGGVDELEKICGDLVRLDRIEGSDILDDDDGMRLQLVLKNVAAEVKNRSTATKTQVMVNNTAPVTPETIIEKKITGASAVKKTQEQTPQPKLGSKSGVKGRVEWKFGGRLCYGTLLPSNETFTHCYARTHKGNVKTLAKGKGYWSIIG